MPKSIYRAIHFDQSLRRIPPKINKKRFKLKHKVCGTMLSIRNLQDHTNECRMLLFWRFNALCSNGMHYTIVVSLFELDGIRRNNQC